MWLLAIWYTFTHVSNKHSATLTKKAAGSSKMLAKFYQTKRLQFPEATASNLKRIYPAQDKDHSGSCELGNKLQVSQKVGNFLTR
jgi:hypothetical protein